MGPDASAAPGGGAGARPLGRVLVVGASGFFGSALGRRLSGSDVSELVGTSRNGTGVPAPATALALDLTDKHAVEQVVSNVRPDTVFQVAGYATGARSLETVIPTLQVNLVGTVNLLVSCTRLGRPRVVVASSYEEPAITEAQPLPRSPYAVAKWSAAGYGRLLHRLYDLPVVNLRVAMGYGPAQRDDRKVVPYLIHALRSGEPARLSSGTRTVDWIYQEDIVDALMAAARQPGATGATVEIGSGRLHSVRDLAERLRDLIDPAATLQFGALQDRPMEDAHAVDVHPAAQILGWSARTSLDEGLRLTVDGLPRLTAFTSVPPSDGRKAAPTSKAVTEPG